MNGEYLREGKKVFLLILCLTFVPILVYAISASDWYSKGIDFQNNKDYDNAIYAYTQAIACNPKYTEAYNNRGINYIDKNLFDEAIHDFNKALEMNPRHISSYNNRAIAYDKKGMFDSAIDDCNKAIAINPNFFASYDNRATVYNHKGLYDEAIADCNQALKLNSKVADVYNVRADAYRQKGMYKEALNDYNKAVSLDSNCVDAFVGRAQLYNALNKTDLALVDFSRAKQINPNIVNNIGIATPGILQTGQQIRKIITIQDKPISLDDYRLYDTDLKILLNLQMTENEVLKNYGEPTERLSEGKRNFVLSYLRSNGKCIFNFGGSQHDKNGNFIRVKMSDIMSQTRLIVTPRNITVGDTEEDLLRAYGEKLVKRSLDNSIFYILNSRDIPSGNLLFVIDNEGKISRISLSSGHGL